MKNIQKRSLLPIASAFSISVFCLILTKIILDTEIVPEDRLIRAFINFFALVIGAISGFFAWLTFEGLRLYIQSKIEKK